MAPTRNFEKAGEARRADHQKSAPQETDMPSTVTSPRGNGGHFKHPHPHGGKDYGK